jgi:protein TonB
MRWLTTGNAVALVFAAAVFGGWYLWSGLNPDDARVVPAVIVSPRIIDPTPEFTPRGPYAGFDVAQEKMGVHEPVPDAAALDEEGGPGAQEPGEGELFNGGYEGPFDDPNGGSFEFEPTVPDTFVAFDELPMLLRIDAPKYPGLAQQAGLEGTVLVKVFVTPAGKVNRAVAVEGPEVFWKAAVTAAQTALFTPAKQGDTPVGVWVIIPVTFSLNR